MLLNKLRRNKNYRLVKELDIQNISGATDGFRVVYDKFLFEFIRIRSIDNFPSTSSLRTEVMMRKIDNMTRFLNGDEWSLSRDPIYYDRCDYLLTPNIVQDKIHQLIKLYSSRPDKLLETIVEIERHITPRRESNRLVLKTYSNPIYSSHAYIRRNVFLVITLKWLDEERSGMLLNVCLKKEPTDIFSIDVSFVDKFIVREPSDVVESVSSFLLNQTENFPTTNYKGGLLEVINKILMVDG